MEESQPFSYDHSLKLAIPFPNAKYAEIAQKVLAVDFKPPNHIQSFTLHLDGAILHLHFQHQSLKTLRAATNGFFDLLKVTCRTIEAFDE